MHAPLYKFGVFGDPMSLVAAFVIGLGFGFFLERAGFASARRLAAQFYFRDLAVLKVMFTAIVTAMVGLFLLSAVGVVDLAQVSLKPTILGADILGGLLLGFGFVIGGYCPGTSVPASATGRVDGWAYVGGLFAGTWVFAELSARLPAFAAYVDEAGKPRLTLAQFTGIPYGTLVLAVAIMAVVAFALAEWAEVTFGGRPLEDQPLIGSGPTVMNPSRRLLGALVVGGLVAALVGNPYQGPNLTVRQDDLANIVARQGDQVSAEDLADAQIAGRVDFRLVDVRSREAFALGSLAGAESVPLVDLASRQFAPTERVLLFAEDSAKAMPAWVFLKARGMTAVYVLQGGLEAWGTRVLHPVVAEPPTAEDLKRIARARALGGAPMVGEPGKKPAPVSLPSAAPVVAPPPAPAGPATPQTRKHEGC